MVSESSRTMHEERKSMIKELMWLFEENGEVISILEDLSSVIAKCRNLLKSPIELKNEGATSNNHNSPLTTGNDCIKGTVEISGFLISKANLNFQFPKVLKGQPFTNIIKESNPWILHQIQTAANFISLAQEEVDDALIELKINNNINNNIERSTIPSTSISSSSISTSSSLSSKDQGDEGSQENKKFKNNASTEEDFNFDQKDINHLKRARDHVIFILNQITMHLNRGKVQLVRPTCLSVTEAASSCNMTTFHPKLPENFIVDFYVDYSNLVTKIYVLGSPTHMPSLHSAKLEKCVINGQQFEVEEQLELESDIPSFGLSLEYINICCELCQRMLDNLQSIDL